MNGAGINSEGLSCLEAGLISDLDSLWIGRDDPNRIGYFFSTRADTATIFLLSDHLQVLYKIMIPNLIKMVDHHPHWEHFSSTALPDDSVSRKGRIPDTDINVAVAHQITKKVSRLQIVDVTLFRCSDMRINRMPPKNQTRWIGLLHD